jgi:hypothetical protein
MPRRAAKLLDRMIAGALRRKEDCKLQIEHCKLQIGAQEVPICNLQCAMTNLQ